MTPIFLVKYGEVGESLCSSRSTFRKGSIQLCAWQRETLLWTPVLG